MTAWSSVAGRGRGDAPRRARLHREAVGRRAAARDGADADRAAARARRRASGCRRRTRGCSAARPRSSSATPRRSSRSGRRSSGSRRRTRRAHHRRARHRARKSSRPGCTRSRERRGKPLVTMNAGGLAEGIAESELFGHVKGAFTDARVDRIGCFELADEGTLFLDEIANMPVRLQAKLLRVLQTGEMQRVGSSRLRYVNVRVLSATNADLPRRDRRRPLPRRSALSPEHRRHPPAAAARPPRGHRAARRALPGASTRRATGSRSPGSSPTPRRRSQAHAGRATCASSRTASSARC